MSLILQIETATASCSVALSFEGKTLAIKEQNERNIHASSLTVFIQEVLQVAGKKLGELQAVAVSKGPGSYTGLRIGVSTAKGLCYALDIPLIGCETLSSMAAGLKASTPLPENTLFCPMIDARRMEVYQALYDSNLNQVTPVEAKIIMEESYRDILETNAVVFFGDGAEKCREVLSGSANARFHSDFINSAKDFSHEAFKKFREEKFEDTAYFEPFYLKDFISTIPKKLV